MRDPSYMRDHPEHGKSGLQRIYRFKNGLGATVDWHYGKQDGFKVTPVHFTGIEITTFSPCGAVLERLDDAQVELALTQLEAGNTPTKGSVNPPPEAAAPNTPLQPDTTNAGTEFHN